MANRVLSADARFCDDHGFTDEPPSGMLATDVILSVSERTTPGGVTEPATPDGVWPRRSGPNGGGYRCDNAPAEQWRFNVVDNGRSFDLSIVEGDASTVADRAALWDVLDRIRFVPAVDFYNRLTTGFDPTGAALSYPQSWYAYAPRDAIAPQVLWFVGTSSVRSPPGTDGFDTACGVAGVPLRGIDAMTASDVFVEIAQVVASADAPAQSVPTRPPVFAPPNMSVVECAATGKTNHCALRREVRCEWTPVLGVGRNRHRVHAVAPGASLASPQRIRSAELTVAAFGRHRRTARSCREHLHRFGIGRVTGRSSRRAHWRASIRVLVIPPGYGSAMGRPRITEERRIATAVRLPESVHQRLHDAAIDRDVSANLLVTRAVTEYLERLPSTDDVLKPRRPRARRGGAS